MQPYLFPLGAAFGTDNLILHAASRKHRVDNFHGPLSIKTVLRGSVNWRLDGREIAVDTRSFLVLNHGDAYSMHIDSPVPVATCCAFFQHGFVERLASDATSPLAAALECAALDRAAPSLAFLSRLHAGGPIPQHVHGLAPRCAGQLQPSGFEEDFLVLATALLNLYKEMTARIARVPAARKSTREELFRRVERAREFIHGQVGTGVSLHAAARAAYLSPFHFHRAFTAAHRQTPHAYVTALRLSRARTQLEGGATVADTAHDAGFANAPAFTRLFGAHFGVNPSKVRKIG
ncbi:MAG: helix-turn-helix domain-containing protein [Bryobacteraceae bacterium]